MNFDNPIRKAFAIFLFIMLIAGIAQFARAVTSVDVCSPECDTHQLEWRPDAVAAWQSVGAPLPLEDITRSDTGAAARGVDWDDKGISSFGEFRGKAARGTDESPFSAPIFIGEPPVAPLLLASLLTVAWIRRR